MVGINLTGSETMQLENLLAYLEALAGEAAEADSADAREWAHWDGIAQDAAGLKLMLRGRMTDAAFDEREAGK